ncbi:hypothetical protein MLD38_006429 [Melastoma candidum]|uniref:Uncharacterized protein n=1 Tax=Melastoma candidum TaxID=119954 RepID=A0ACB9RQV4_9MYRT|nr:hypothetical protein MLD38_006429 [Melastoma candidum]
MDYPPRQSSNKVFDVVRRFQILGKWKRLGSSSSSSSSFYGNDSGSLRRTSSSPLEEKATTVIPKGCFVVSVGDVEKRFVLPTKFLGHPLFGELLREAEEEFGFQQKGVLRIPIDVFLFEHVLRKMEGQKKRKKLGRQGKSGCVDNDYNHKSWSLNSENLLSPEYETNAFEYPSCPLP